MRLALAVAFVVDAVMAYTSPCLAVGATLLVGILFSRGRAGNENQLWWIVRYVILFSLIAILASSLFPLKTGPIWEIIVGLLLFFLWIITGGDARNHSEKPTEQF